MQTFLPHSTPALSAKALDRTRLGCQRKEAKQILGILAIGPKSPRKRDGKVVTTPWYNHPAVKMWLPYRGYLAMYGVTVCGEWKSRGFVDNLERFFMEQYQKYDYVIPPWIGDEEFHASHRSNLLRKNAVHYSSFGWSEPATTPYFWPTKSSRYSEFYAKRES